MKFAARLLLSVLLIGSGASVGVAQQQDPLVRLEPNTRMQVEILLDSARLFGLPPAPLESKALEGISKRVDNRKILFAVRNVFRSLRDAKVVLGPRATAAELEAAASALRVGLTQDELQQLARGKVDKPLTVPLVVLVDLISRGVPRDTASTTISQLWQRGAGDEDFYGLWRGVERDIVSGTDPGVALRNRAREIPTRTPPQAQSARPDVPETPNE